MKNLHVVAGNGTEFLLKVLKKTEEGFSVEVSCPGMKKTILVLANELEAWPALSSEQIAEDTASLSAEEVADYMEDGPGEESGSICIKSGEGGFIISSAGILHED